MLLNDAVMFREPRQTFAATDYRFFSLIGND